MIATDFEAAQRTPKARWIWLGGPLRCRSRQIVSCLGVSDTWWYSVMIKGRRVQVSTRQKNKNVAIKMESAHRVQLLMNRVGIFEAKSIPGFKTAMTDFLSWSEKEHAAKPATYRRYKVSSVALLKHFKDVPLDKITPDEVEKFKTMRLNSFKTVRAAKGRRQATSEHVKPATVNRELACLRAVFNHVAKSGVQVVNPISKNGAHQLQENNEHTRVLSYDEQSRYLSAAATIGSGMLLDVATIMLETGMRPEEVYRIQPKSVNLANSSLYNPYGKTKAAKRTIKLTRVALDVLKRRIEEAEGSYLFPHDDDINKPVPKVNNAHDRALALSGIEDLRLYDLRHTFATRAVEAGVDLVTLAAMLGHSKINMVLRYAHPTQEHQSRAMDKIERHVAERQIETAAQSTTIPATVQ